MKFTLLLSLICCLAISSCNTEKKSPNTDIEVAREFIKNILESNFKDAETFVLKEETNQQFFELFKKEFESKTKSELESFKNADIIINEISPLNDSVSIINYSNSFKKDKTNKLKMVRINGQWMVDLKYTFSGNL
ncbi:MAG: DUF4878 domain-containing protein [Chitinophagia bacterium]|jgi:hypothetical protein|nr:DUF4878 domain-containing protein [Chitinophagia bacterium]